MKNYVKPMVVANDGLAESVYMASGDCYKVTWTLTQKPEGGRENYCFQFDADHNAADGHHSKTQELTIIFNQPVKNVTCTHSTDISGDGTNVIVVRYAYHNNGVDHDGLGNIYAESGEGLAVNSAYMSCDHQCAYNHEW